MAIRVSANLRPWAAMRVLADELEDISELLKFLEGEGFAVSTRYGDGADALPDPEAMCPGDCEGMGVVPIDRSIMGLDALDGEAVGILYSPEDVALYRPLWEEAEAQEPSEDGWHFVKCPTCGGTGKRLPAKQAIGEAVGEASVAWTPDGVFDTEAAGIAADRLARRLGIVTAGKKTIVFDFDGTIAEERTFPEIGDPIWETIERMRAAKDAGIEVVIQSCRWSVHELSTEESAAANMVVAKAWLDEHEVPYDRLVAGKPLAELYVDDRACLVQDLQRLDHAIMEMASEHPVDGSLKVKAFGDTHEWGCLMLEAPEDLAAEVRAWGEKSVPEGDLFLGDEDDGGYGRENQVHATVSYGIDPSVTPDALRDVLLEQGVPVELRLGKVSKFSKPEDGYDVIKIEVDSPHLHRLHEAIEKAVGTPGNTYPDYKPHMTVAYVKPGSCDHLIGQEPFAGRELRLGRFDYGRPEAPGKKDIHDYMDLGIEVEASAEEDKIRKDLEDAAAWAKENEIKKGYPGYAMAESPESTRARQMAEKSAKVQKMRRSGKSEKEIAEWKKKNPLRKWIWAAQFDDLRKAAMRLIEDDPSWKSLIHDPASAQAYGQLQQSIRDARSDAELESAWTAHMDLPWEAVKAEAGGRKKA